MKNSIEDNLSEKRRDGKREEGRFTSQNMATVAFSIIGITLGLS